MQQHRRSRFAALVALGLGVMSFFAGCGGDMTAGIQGSGFTGGIAAVGPITGFGSIFVDGVEYATGGAQISIDDQSATESQLRVGQVVTIKGTVNADGVTGTATTVSFANDLRGPITQIDVNAQTFLVLGQTVRVTDATLFDDSLVASVLADMPVNTPVEVSGFLDSAGVLIASRIEAANASGGLQVRGIVQALDTTARTFRINTLTVDYSGVSPSGTLSNGASVTVQGSTLSSASTLIATKVKVSGGLGAGANDRGQLEGVITSFTSNASFSVNGQAVTTDGTTLITPQGATLGLDVRVKVHGTFNASGVLAANKIEVRPQSLSLVRGTVDAVSATARTLTVLGVSISTSSTTSFEDKSSQQIRLFSLADVRVGDYVEVRGIGDASSLSAITLERQRPDARVYLQGVARNVAAPSFTILGVTVMTDAQTHFAGSSGGQDAAAQFFAAAANQIVRVRGTLVGNQLVADQAQIRQQ